ncbi:MAG: hypothetical protein AAF224_06135 [Pseudomonadota bacterium]
MVENEKDKSTSADKDDGTVLSEAELNTLLDAAPAPAASDPLQRAILDDFDRLYPQHAASADVSTEGFRKHGSIGARQWFSAIFSNVRLASARLGVGALAAVAVLGFSIGVVTNSAPGASSPSLAANSSALDEQEFALTYFTSTLSDAFSDTAFYAGEESLWRVE